MIIKDLKERCEACGGSGRQASISQWGISQINPDGRCIQCGGRGFTLTQLGEELVTMLRPFMEEIIDEREKAQPATPRTAPKPPEDPSEEMA